MAVCGRTGRGRGLPLGTRGRGQVLHMDHAALLSRVLQLPQPAQDRQEVNPGLAAQ